MKKRLSNIWDPIRSWLGCVYLQIIKIVLYSIFVFLAIWALVLITRLKTTQMEFNTEAFALDSITITYEIDIEQWPSKLFDKYEVSISYDYPSALKEIMSVFDNRIPLDIPQLKDSIRIKRFYNIFEERQQLNYDRSKHYLYLFHPAITTDCHPLDSIVIVERQDSNSPQLSIQHFEFDSLTIASNPMGLFALDGMTYYYYPDKLIDFIKKNKIEFPGGLIHSYFNYYGAIEGFEENELLTGIPPCDILLGINDSSFSIVKLVDSMELRKYYTGFFNDRDYILHYQRTYKTPLFDGFAFESYHEYSLDKLSLLTPATIPTYNLPQTTIQEIEIYDPYNPLFYPYDLSKEYLDIYLDFNYSIPCSANSELNINFNDYFHLLSSSLTPSSIGADYIEFAFDDNVLHDSNILTLFADYPKLQAIQNARVTLLTVLISILFTLVIAEFVRIIQITRNKSKMNKLMAKGGFVCYGSAPDCINCLGYDKCKGSKYRFSIKTQDRYSGMKYMKPSKKRH